MSLLGNVKGLSTKSHLKFTQCFNGNAVESIGNVGLPAKKNPWS